MKLGIYILLYLVSLSKSYAIIPLLEDKELTVPFFRTPLSQFPSGTKALKILKSSMIQIKEDPWYLVEGKNNKQWVPQSRLLFISQFKEIFKQVNQNNNQLSLEQNFGILKGESSSMKFQKGWREGKVIKEGTLIKINSIRSDWTCGEINREPTCVPTNSIVLASDFAERAKLKNGIWVQLKDRNNHFLITNDKKFIPFHNFSIFEISSSLALITPLKNQLNPKLIQFDDWEPYEKVVLVKKELRKWSQSLLPDHGNVWWLEPNKNGENRAFTVISNDELNQRPISFIAQKIQTSEKSKKLSLVSANGIFYSNDNEESWVFIEQFGETNFPVAIGPRNSLIVGDQISFNQGKSFQNYLRWDHIARLTQMELRHTPSLLILSSLKPKGPSKFEISIDTGDKEFQFEINMTNNQLTIINSRY